MRAFGARGPRCAACCSGHALYKDTLPARGLSSLVHGRAPTYWLRPVTQSMRCVSRGASATALSLSLSLEEAQRARLRDMLIGAMHYTRLLRQLEASFDRCTVVL